MSAKRQHRHWVTAIETRATTEKDSGDPYGGIRVAVHHSQADAQSDLKEWITDELEEEFDTLDEAVEAYTERTGKRVIMEEQYA